MTNDMDILSKDSALSYYNKVCKICSSPDNINNKILNLGTILEDVFKEITKNDVESLATLFDRQKFIEQKFDIPEMIKDYHKVRVVSNNLRHNSNYNANNADYIKSVERVIATINYFSDNTFSAEAALASVPEIDAIQEKKRNVVAFPKRLNVNSETIKPPTPDKKEQEKPLSDLPTVKEMAIQNLANILADMYQNSSDDKVAMIHLFGIKYANEIHKLECNANDIIKKARLKDGSCMSAAYKTEISKGIKLAKYVIDKKEQKTHLVDTSAEKSKKMTAQNLAEILADMYQNSNDDKVAMIHLFGIVYADEIHKSGCNANDIIKKAQLKDGSYMSDNYKTEINKGINLAKYVIVRKTTVDYINQLTGNPPQ